MKTEMLSILQQSLQTQQAMIQEIDSLCAIANVLIAAMKRGNKLMLCGNAGSAADAQHIAAEFVNRFLMNRRALPALALTTDTSILTAVGNDDVYDHVFVRQIEALAQPGDVLAAISTSGNSKNIIAAVQAAKRRQCATIGITGASGGTLKGMTDVIFCAPSHQTPRIQECHLVMWHSVCEIVEQALCS